MQVHKLNNCQINFGTLARCENLYKFSDTQNKYAEEIETQMRQPLEKFNGKTAEDYYKSKGYDFLIMPIQKDRIKVKGYIESKMMSEPIFIGTYGEENRFKLSDVEKKLPSEKTDKPRRPKKFYICAYAFLLSALTATILLTNNNTKLNKTPIKKVDTIETIKNKTDSVLSDTTLKKNIFKTIKR